jgi:hypothetical protein
MKRPAPVKRDPAEVTPFPDDEWNELFPLLSEHLAHDLFEDGTSRRLSSVSVKAQDGLVLVSLSDVELSRGLYRVGPNVMAALEALEKALADPRADWRPWKKFDSPKRK